MWAIVGWVMVSLSARTCGLVGALCLLGGCEVRGVIGSNTGRDGGNADGADDGGVTGDGGGIADDDDDDGGGSQGGGGTTTSADDGDTDEPVFDVGTPDAPEVCKAPLAVSCDSKDADPWHALGINCGEGFEADVSHDGDPFTMVVHEGALGTSGVYEPREGERFLILSTGDALDMTMTPAELNAVYGCDPELCPSQHLNPAPPMLVLPDPIDYRRVADDRSCADDPTLIGKGDCSNTLQAEFLAGEGALDYTEIRIKADVPMGADALGYNFAFFTVEYPAFASRNHDSAWNDMYVAWLQSESWTGNVSFDGAGNPISINSVLLDYRDFPEGSAPELAGFAAQGHGGTDWLETIAPVTPGESVELVFAIMDLTDGFFDSAVILDGFHWTCTDLPPITDPAG